ncbi:MAG: hypothetical protein IJ113_00820 [Eggerthellaceae bacterium]|nr:hypothetical protein [Eggerthellaceae bacterium]
MKTKCSKLLHAIFDTSRRERRLRVLFAVLFAICFVIGDSFRDYGSLFATLDEPRQAIKQLVFFALYFLGGYVGICLAAFAVRHSREHGRARLTVMRTWPVFLVFVLAWAPYVVCNFPGSVPYDTVLQINQGLGAASLNTHHPTVLSLYFGAIITVARAVGVGDIGGIFVLTLIQLVFTALVFSELVRFVDEAARRRVLTFGAIAFFALYPTWGMMVEGIIKDAPYTGFFVLFVLAYTRCVLATSPENRLGPKGVDGAPGLREFVMLAVGALGMCFCRNNGIHVLILSAIPLLLLRQDPRIRAKEAASLASVVLVFFLVTGPLYSALGVKPGPIAEALSIPVQQVARYVAEYDTEITPLEKSVINGVLDYETIKDEYDPQLSDPVKATFHNNATQQEQLAFLKLYLELAQQHPRPFIEAPLHNSYRYYSFTDFSNTRACFQNYTKFAINKSLAYDDYLPFTKAARKVTRDWAELVTNVPILNILNRCGFFTWVLLLCLCSALVRRQPKEIMAAIPLIISILVCIASPVNGLQRYMWPVMAAIWVPIALSFAGTMRRDASRGARREHA